MTSVSRRSGRWTTRKLVTWLKRLCMLTRSFTFSNFLLSGSLLGISSLPSSQNLMLLPVILASKAETQLPKVIQWWTRTTLLWTLKVVKISRPSQRVRLLMTKVSLQRTNILLARSMIAWSRYSVSSSVRPRILLMQSLQREANLLHPKNLSRLELTLFVKHSALKIWLMLNSWLTSSMDSRSSTRRNSKKKRNWWKSKRPKRL